MAKFKKKDLNELVGGDITSDGGDSTFNTLEIQTGPYVKSYDDDSDYEKGRPTTTDKVFARYRQDIPWFAVYSFGGTRSSGGVKTFESKIMTKKDVETKIKEDLVKKGKNHDIQEKNPKKIKKVLEMIKELTPEEIEEIKKDL